MEYVDYYLKFPDEATQLQYHNPDGDPPVLLGDGYYAVSIVGIIRTPTGQMLIAEDGSEYPEMVAVPGWHMNVRSKLPLPANLEPFLITPPATPGERWY